MKTQLGVPWRVEWYRGARDSQDRIQILDSGGNLICEMSGTSKRDMKVAQEICSALNMVKYAGKLVES